MERNRVIVFGGGDWRRDGNQCIAGELTGKGRLRLIPIGLDAVGPHRLNANDYYIQIVRVIFRFA
jgi:hypothetical protein